MSGVNSRWSLYSCMGTFDSFLALHNTKYFNEQLEVEILSPLPSEEGLPNEGLSVCK